MRPRKRDFRGDARKGAKNYDTVSSDDSEVYRRKDPFAGRNRKRLPVRTGGRNAISATLLFDLDGHSIECLFFALMSTNAQATAAGYYRKYQSSEQRAAIVNSRMALQKYSCHFSTCQTRTNDFLIQFDFLVPYFNVRNFLYKSKLHVYGDQNGL